MFSISIQNTYATSTYMFFSFVSSEPIEWWMVICFDFAIDFSRHTKAKQNVYRFYVYRLYLHVDVDMYVDVRLLIYFSRSYGYAYKKQNIWNP